MFESVLSCIYFYLGVMPLIGGIVGISATSDFRDEGLIKNIYTRFFILTTVSEKIYMLVSIWLFYLWLSIILVPSTIAIVCALVVLLLINYKKYKTQ